MNQPFTRIAILLLLFCLGALQAQAGPANAPAPATAIPVEVGIKLDQITNIDQKAENFTAIVTVLMNYRDPKLVYERDPDKPAFRMMETPGFLKLVQKNNRTGPRSSFRTARAGAIPLPT